MIILRLGPVTTLIIIWVCLCSFVPLFNTDSPFQYIFVLCIGYILICLYIYIYLFILWPLKHPNVQQVHARSKKKTMTGRINVIFCFMHVNSLYGRGYEHGCSTWVLLPVFLIHTNNDYQWTCITNHSLKIRLMSIIDGWSLLRVFNARGVLSDSHLSPHFSFSRSDSRSVPNLAMKSSPREVSSINGS